MDKIREIADQYSTLHLQILDLLEKADTKAVFQKNPWKKDLGEGLTCVIENGAVIEKAGVNFSFVSGELKENMEKTLGIESTKGLTYGATGISSIIHSSNPFVPTIHFNVRYFGLSNGIEWFGGGIDLTPTYIDLFEAREFHLKVKDICDKYSLDYYKAYKKWADDYFFLPHRNETRGVGGIFFDRVQPKDEQSFDRFFEFTLDLAKAYPSIYANIASRKRNTPYTEENKEWQLLRRGRYVEFNLLYDRGTKFGIETGGNIESILVSLPAEVNWKYNYCPKEASPEQNTLDLLKKGIDWLTV